MAMGAADAIPGVSGGTIAFISGIYEELVNTLSNLSPLLIKTLFKEGFFSFWKQINGNFLLALLTGILVSFVSFMRLAKYLLENQPILIWSFFFGLIIASIIYVGKSIKNWKLSTYVSLIVGTIGAYLLTSLPALNSNDSNIYLFFSGAIAICAWILPGISGSFILLLLGSYKTLSQSFETFDIKKIILFALGAIIGLLSFSKLLKWLFKHYENTTLALVTGFIIGALHKIWPWKQTLTVYSKEMGEVVSLDRISNFGSLTVHQKSIQNFDNLKTVLEKSISPSNFSAINQNIDAQILPAVCLMVIGFLSIFIIEKIAALKIN